MLLVSTLIVACRHRPGLVLLWQRCRRQASRCSIRGGAWPGLFAVLAHKFYVDELYEASVIRANLWWAQACDWLDRFVWNGAVLLVSSIVLGLAWFDRFFDEYVVNLGFDEGCRDLRRGGRWLCRLQGGQVQYYLRVIGVGLSSWCWSWVGGAGDERLSRLLHRLRKAWPFQGRIARPELLLMNGVPLLTILTLLPLAAGLLILVTSGAHRGLARRLRFSPASFRFPRASSFGPCSIPSSGASN